MNTHNAKYVMIIYKSFDISGVLTAQPQMAVGSLVLPVQLKSIFMIYEVSWLPLNL